MLRLALLLALAFATVTARASFPSFAIEELYSNADGTVQFIVLRETQGMNGQNALAGRTLAVTHAGVTKSLTFPSDLPSSDTAGKRVLLATPAFSGVLASASELKAFGEPIVPIPPVEPIEPPATSDPPIPDFVIPPRFLATDGATVDFAGADRLTYDALPTDGTKSLLASGTRADNVAIDFAGRRARVPMTTVTVVEYRNASLDHYFVSALAPDIDALDSGRTPGWTRTGLSFKAWPAADLNVNPVCRFYIPPQRGNSHFISASPDECANVLDRTRSDPNYSGYVYESPNVFYIALPDVATGACPVGTTPVYRLFDNRVDANHRYAADRAARTDMLAHGYIAEGYGPDAVAMCAPQ